MTNYIYDIKLSAGTLSVPTRGFDPTDSTSTKSAEEAALSWLVYNDQLHVLPNSALNKFRWQQRYAVLTLLLQYGKFVADNSTKDHECEWRHVNACFSAANQSRKWDSVADIVISLDKARLGSTLSADLGLLSNMTRFNVASSALTGSLPPLLGTSWTNLQFFHVNDNALSGSLPSSLGTAWNFLSLFDVSGNALTGRIPSALGSNWSSIEYAYFSNNSLVGPMARAFCYFTLTSLWADCYEVSCSCCTGCCSDATGECKY